MKMFKNSLQLWLMALSLVTAFSCREQKSNDPNDNAQLETEPVDSYDRKTEVKNHRDMEEHPEMNEHSGLDGEDYQFDNEALDEGSEN